MAQLITAWSYSRYKTYTDCPAKAKFLYIDKLQEPKNPAMDRGTVIHKLAEDYTLGRIKKIPQELMNFEEQFKELKKSRPMVEQEWAFDSAWGLTSWFDKTTWLRVKVDAACKDGSRLYVIDHKTGKIKSDGAYEDQLELYAVSGLIRVPGIEEISTQLWFLDHKEDPIENTYNKAQLEKLKASWEKRVRAMMNDKRFPPKPGNHCKYCHFRKDNGGPCKY